MRKGGGKTKGASFERDVCKKLSLWISENKMEDVYWRSAMSGGRGTVAKAKGKKLGAQAGDISCIHPVGAAFAERFFIECKFVKDLDYQGIFTKTGSLVQYWKTARQEAKHYGKLPLLIAKQNQQPAIVAMSRDGAALVGMSKLIMIAPQLGMRIMLFEDFLKWAKRI